jgi:hypothetical protein
MLRRQRRRKILRLYSFQSYISNVLALVFVMKGPNWFLVFRRDAKSCVCLKFCGARCYPQ